MCVCSRDSAFKEKAQMWDQDRKGAVNHKTSHIQQGYRAKHSAMAQGARIHLKLAWRYDVIHVVLVLQIWRMRRWQKFVLRSRKSLRPHNGQRERQSVLQTAKLEKQGSQVQWSPDDTTTAPHALHGAGRFSIFHEFRCYFGLVFLFYCPLLSFGM